MKRIGQNRIEWALFAVIAVVCAVLPFLQYRWAGELSRAEPVLLRASLSEQLRRLVEGFNNDIRESCTALLPDAKEIRSSAPAKLTDFAMSSGFPLMKRTWLRGSRTQHLTKENSSCIASTARLELLLWNGRQTGDLFARRCRPVFRVRDGHRTLGLIPDLIELPVFADPSGTSELEWMLFDLNEDYVRTRVLPQLVAEYLNADGEGAYDVSVSRSGPGGQVVFSTRSDHSSVASGADASAGTVFNRDGHWTWTRPGTGAR